MFKYLTLTASLFLFCAGSNASGAQLSKDIANIAKAALTKGELETTAEFNHRVEREYAKYRNKIYDVKVDVSNPLNSGHKWLS